MEENSEQNDDAAKQLEAEKARLLEEVREELRKEQHSQNQVLEIARRLAQLQGQDPDKGKCGCCHTMFFAHFRSYQIRQKIRGAVIVDAGKQIKCIITGLLPVVTLRDFQRPDSDEETEDQAALRIIKQVGGQSLFFNS